MKLDTLDDLFVHTLKDVLYAEKRGLKALPKMAKQVSAPDLRKALEAHHKESETQIERLETVFDMLDRSPRGAKCEAMLGIIEEAEDLMEQAASPEVKDAAIVSAAQAVEHYEIARYGTLAAMANQLGLKDAAKLFRETLKEEKASDEKLSKIAEKTVNKEAA